MPTKTKKTVPVKSLRKAIQDGMSHKEAAKQALAVLKPKLNMVSETVDICVESFLEDIITFMSETEDHSIRFKVEEDKGDESLSWCLCPYEGNHESSRWGDCVYFYPFNMDHARYKAEEDAKTLNQFILDFYGIKKHGTTKGMARTKAKQIRTEISNKQKEIKALQAELKKFI